MEVSDTVSKVIDEKDGGKENEDTGRGIGEASVEENKTKTRQSWSDKQGRVLETAKGEKGSEGEKKRVWRRR